MPTYKDKIAADNYINFLNSKNGKIQTGLLFKYIKNTLNKPKKILDAGCGSGWLLEKLKNELTETEIFACDYSNELLTIAKNNNPELNIRLLDLEENLPYEKEFFDIVIMNMVAQDTNSLEKVFQNISQILKTDGELIITIPNPYYSYPVAEWKRSIIGKILRFKPKILIKKPYHKALSINRKFSNGTIESNFYPLETYINRARNSGLIIDDYNEIKSYEDSNDFDLKYQSFRYPLILLLKFKKQISPIDIT